MSLVEQVVDSYVDSYGEDAGVGLLKVLADPRAGGDGYKVRMHPMLDADGWEVNKAAKLIELDTTNWGFEMDASDLAENLNEAIETEIFSARWCQ